MIHAPFLLPLRPRRRIEIPAPARCPGCGRRRRRPAPKPLRFSRDWRRAETRNAAGDVLLDSAGNQILDAYGNVVLDDGAKNTCCCPCFQARKCSDNSLANLWWSGALPSDPFYAKRTADGICYSISSSDTGTCGTLFGAYSSISGCADASCGGGCTCPATRACGSCTCTPTAFTITFSNVSIYGGCIACSGDGTAAQGAGFLNGTYCLAKTGTCLWTAAASGLSAQIGANCGSLSNYTPYITLNRLDASNFKLYVDNIQTDYPASTLFFYSIFSTALNDCSSGWTVNSTVAGNYGTANCAGLDTYYLGGDTGASPATAILSSCC